MLPDYVWNNGHLDCNVNYSVLWSFMQNPQARDLSHALLESMDTLKGHAIKGIKKILQKDKTTLSRQYMGISPAHILDEINTNTKLNTTILEEWMVQMTKQSYKGFQTQNLIAKWGG